MQEKTAEQPDAVVLPRVEASTSDFLTLHEIIAKARANLDQNCWDYIVGGTETETTLRRNRMALDSIAFRPRVLRDVYRIDASVERFGRKLRLPVMLAPVGSLESFNPEGAAPIVRGARRVRRRPYAVVGVRARARSGRQGRARRHAHLPALCARRRRLCRRPRQPRHRQRLCRVLHDGRYRALQPARARHRQALHHRRPPPRGRPRLSGGLDWRTVKRIKERFKIPLVLKGIATAEDAKIAVEHGVEWVYISNHGGRQLDHGRGSMDVLPEVVEAVGRPREDH